jgi:hypothetical protein
LPLPLHPVSRLQQLELDRLAVEHVFYLSGT